MISEGGNETHISVSLYKSLPALIGGLGAGAASACVFSFLVLPGGFALAARNEACLRGVVVGVVFLAVGPAATIAGVIAAYLGRIATGRFHYAGRKSWLGLLVASCHGLIWGIALREWIVWKPAWIIGLAAFVLVAPILAARFDERPARQDEP